MILIRIIFTQYYYCILFFFIEVFQVVLTFALRTVLFSVSSTGVARNRSFVALLAFPFLVLLFIGLFLWCKYHRKSQVPENRSYYNARESIVVIESSQRESAYIGVPQQETNPNMSGDLEDYPGLPVEETMPVILTTEKQDNIAEE